MLLAHISDTHLGFSEYRYEDPETGANLREMDVYRAFRAACATIREMHPDLVLHTGDLFHGPRPPVRALVTAIRELGAIARERIPVVVIAGNHDLPQLRGEVSPLEVLSAVEGIHAVSSSHQVVRVEGAAIHAVPHSRVEADLRRALETAVPTPDAPVNLLALHAGLRDSGGSPWSEAAVPRSLLASKTGAFDYVGLGHYHRPTKVAENAWYAGSTERFHPEEAGYEKGFLRIDLDRGSVRHIPISGRPFLESPPLPCRNRTARQITRDIEARLAGAPPGAVCRITLEGVARRQERDLDPRALRSRFPSLLRLEIRIRRRRGSPGGSIPDSDASLPERFESYLRACGDDPRLVSLFRAYLARVASGDLQ